jgi:hypothetical protein
LEITQIKFKMLKSDELNMTTSQLLLTSAREVVPLAQATGTG